MRTDICHIIEKITQTVLTFGATDTSKTMTFKKTGYLRGITWATSNWASADTISIAVTDEDSAQIYSTTGLAKNSTAHVKPDVALCVETHTITVTMSGTGPGAGGGTVTLTPLIER